MKRNIVTYFVTAMVAGCALVGCDLLDNHPYDVAKSDSPRINEVNAKKIERACDTKTTLVIAVISDTQGWYDETLDFVRDVNKRKDVDFVIHLGDFTDYGSAREFEWQRKILDKLNVPYVCDLGNHDCLGTGLSTYRYLFGPIDYSFIAGRVKFLMLNTNALEFDFTAQIPDLNFIEDECESRRDEFDRTVVTMHGKPYSDVFDNNLAEAFQNIITRLPGLMFCLNGHNHKAELNDIFGDGIIYYQTPSIDKRQYYLFTITPTGYSYETVNY
ncbi:MAG: metallophosphoesterase [Muribaculaceae bacterium]|nr:metallophosphoesterase [Muribaculaceae bacterium]